MPSCPCMPSGVSPEDDGKGYDGPPDSRRCTDVLCLIVFILFCGVGATLNYQRDANPIPPEHTSENKVVLEESGEFVKAATIDGLIKLLRKYTILLRTRAPTAGKSSGSES